MPALANLMKDPDQVAALLKMAATWDALAKERERLVAIDASRPADARARR